MEWLLREQRRSGNSSMRIRKNFPKTMPTQYAGTGGCFLFFSSYRWKKPGSDLSLEMLDYALKNLCVSWEGECYGLHKRRFSSGEKSRCELRKRESSEYLRRFPQAGYIIGNMVLSPGSFVKKEAGLFLTMLEIYDRKSVETAEFLSVTARGAFENRLYLRPSKSKAKEAWLEKMHPGKKVMMEMWS